MYEKTMQHRLLVYMAAGIAVLLLMWLDNVQFMSSVLYMVDDSAAGVALYAVVFVLVCAATFLPGVYLLRRERIPNAVLINMFGAGGGVLATVWTIYLPMSFMKAIMAMTWCMIFIFYGVGYEFFVQMGRKRAWVTASFIIFVGVAGSIATFIFRLNHLF